MALAAILRNSSKSPVLCNQSSTSIIRSLTSNPSFDQPHVSGIDQGSQRTALFNLAGITPKQSISQNSAASSVMNYVRYMTTTTGARSVIGRSALSSMVGQDLQGHSIRFGDHRGYSSYSGGKTTDAVPNARLRTILGFAASPVTHIYDGIKEIMADYVHHDMTRNLILLYMRLFFIIQAKDIVVLFL